MRYREQVQAIYRSRTADMIMYFEGYRSRPYDAHDGMATIGFGYTFNRDNNVELFERAGIPVTAAQRASLVAIDEARGIQRTRLGLAAPITLTRGHARSLLEHASLERYEDVVEELDLPMSDERGVVVSLTYNRGAGRVGGDAMRPFRDAITQEDRAEAWYQIRYNSWGTSAADETGLRKRRGMEAQIFGLYDDVQSVTREEALSAYRMLELHRADIERLEHAWGVGFDGLAQRGNNNIIEMANRDYLALTQVHGAVPTITDAMAPARDRLLQDLRREHPDLAAALRDDAFPPLAVFIDPGRNLRAAPFPRHPAARASWPNSSAQAQDSAHDAVLDSRLTRQEREIGRRDLLIGEAGNDTLRGGLGADILLGGAGDDRYDVDAGDIVKDSDGRGTLVWAGRVLDGGVLDPVTGQFRSADGAYTYVLEATRLVITNAAGESVRVEGFHAGNLGIRLDTTDHRAHDAPMPLPMDPRNPAHRDHALFQQAERAVARIDADLVRDRDASSERMIAAGVLLAKANGLERIDHLLLSRQTVSTAAGHNVFVVCGPLDDPASLRAHMPTAAALATPSQQSYAQIEALRPDRSQDVDLHLQRHEIEAKAVNRMQGA